MNLLQQNKNKFIKFVNYLEINHFGSPSPPDFLVSILQDSHNFWVLNLCYVFASAKVILDSHLSSLATRLSIS
jgi:hypothetical protein